MIGGSAPQWIANRRGMGSTDGPTTVGKAGDFGRVRAEVVLEEIGLSKRR